MTSHGTRDTTPQRVPCLDSYHKRLASVEQHRPRRGDDGVGHEKDGLPGLRRDLLLHHSAALPEVHLDRRRQRGNLLILRHCDEWRTVGLAVLFVRIQSVGEIKGHVILSLREVSDLATLRYTTAEIAELAHSEPRDSWIFACFNFHHFGIQSTPGAAGYPEPP